MPLQQTLEQLFETVTSTEARVAATAVILVAALATAVVLTPRLVAITSRLVRRAVTDNDRVPIDPPKFEWGLLVSALVRTLQLVVFLTAGIAVLFAWGLADLGVETIALLATAVPRLVQLLVTIGVVAAAVIGIDVLETRLERYAEDSDTLDEHQEGIVFRVLQLSVIVAAGLASLSVWGVNLGGLLVGAGFLGIVIGTAARTTIGSFIAGFVLMFSRPFELGDWVEIDGEEGNVTDITIVNTRIRNQHGEEVVIPNERVANATITNRSRRGRHRLSVEVGVDYDAPVEEAETVVADALEAVDVTLDTPSSHVVPTSLGDSAVVLECRFWISHPSAAKRARAKAAVVREVKAALDEADIKIPFPQRELTGREETGGFRLSGREHRGISSSE